MNAPFRSRISIVRLPEQTVVESSTLKSSRGKIFQMALDRAHRMAEKLGCNYVVRIDGLSSPLSPTQQLLQAAADRAVMQKTGALR